MKHPFKAGAVSPIPVGNKAGPGVSIVHAQDTTGADRPRLHSTDVRRERLLRTGFPILAPWMALRARLRGAAPLTRWCP